MTAENHVYFPRSGAEASAFVLVRLFAENGEARAEASLAGPDAKAEDGFDGGVRAGEPSAVLRDAREKAGLTGLDLRVALDGVDWDPELGSLVDPK